MATDPQIPVSARDAEPTPLFVVDGDLPTRSLGGRLAAARRLKRMGGYDY